jgi:nucleoside-diphosphate-sugar epimerase
VALNVAGCDVDLRALAIRLRDLIGSGLVATEPMPAHIAAIDPGAATIDQRRLTALIGVPPQSDLDDALARTVAYFRERLG